MSNLKLSIEPNLEKKHDAFDYQTNAVEKIKDLPYAAIFHEQGLGKSKIAIDTMIYWLEKNLVDTIILVAKKGLIENWKREFKNHSFLKPLVLTTNRIDNFQILNTPTRLILTHYEAIKFEKLRLITFLKTRRVGVILDESTKIKNPYSELTKVFFKISQGFEKKIILTGTPVANRPYDIWAQIRFLDNGVSLGDDFESFKKECDLNGGITQNSDSSLNFENALLNIKEKISVFSVRENKQSEFIKLPEKIIINVDTDWESAQKILYKKYKYDLGATIKKNNKDIEDNADDIIKRLLRLVQIASNPLLVDDSYQNIPGKWNMLISILKKIKENNEKAIIWSNFTENVNWLSENLREYNSVKLHGKLNMYERNRAVTKFIDDPNVFLFIATPGAAKEGLTLTVANHAIFFDRGFSLDDYLQSQDRIHRVSQIKTCYIYNLLMKDSIDEWVEELINSKRLAAQLTQGDITIDFFKKNMTYTFSQILHEVLYK